MHCANLVIQVCSLDLIVVLRAGLLDSRLGLIQLCLTQLNY